ncbi:hypothetical protein EMCG_05473 [[Emmonsia] crescens]|uniref:SWIRM domain-containing protein n=1 Tax=[Emmonsia] crescens TaxID=73230 RepID=A0A0G2HPS1_9EURO|nr:hypothetical protein EMCG_05473 [Emmonsia crescens UAMH 3008]
MSLSEDLAEKHMAMQMTRFHHKVNKPTREDYLLAMHCTPTVSTQYNRNPGAWAMKEREILDRQLLMMTRLAPCDGGYGVIQHVVDFSYEATPTPEPSPIIGANHDDSFMMAQLFSSGSSVTQQVVDSSEEATPTPGPGPIIEINCDDSDYKSLPDYCPPIDTLQGKLDAVWVGRKLDLSRDPDRHVLVPAEVELAATLRLSCATYLCSKRRIFEACLKAKCIGKEFRKTDAQKACRIDVNKASRLWTAYEKIGWFKPEYFQHYL